MITLEPVDGTLDGHPILIVGYIPEADRMLVYSTAGAILTPMRGDVTVDWHASTDELSEQLAIAIRGLTAINEYTHAPTCPNKADFSVWDCNCMTLKPDVMARLTLEELEYAIEDEDVSVPEVPDADPT